MYYCLLRELVYHLDLNYTKFRLAFLEVSSRMTNDAMDDDEMDDDE